ncbi:MAG: DMT family transporter [Pirellulaceae bacterium]|nr:DMT family transporter [Pirellulaceae bacterium]
MPLGSSVLVIFGLLLLKRAQDRGVSPWTAMILLSWTSAGIFSLLTLLGGTMQPLSLWWQPAVIGALFMAGQFFTFLAVKLGDVSIAAPVQGVKVLLVPAASLLIVSELPPPRIWIAACIALAGIVCVQWNDATVNRSRVVISVGFALLGSVSMTALDLLIQRWAPAWGAGYFLPLAFASAALFSLAFLPLADAPRRLAPPGILIPLVAGAVLMSVQAIGMTFTLAQFGDASRVNIVYSLRGLWGVGLTWLLLCLLPAAHHRPSQRVMAMRLLGAVLIAISVLLSLTSRGPSSILKRQAKPETSQSHAAGGGRVVQRPPDPPSPQVARWRGLVQPLVDRELAVDGPRWTLN